ncbi:Ig-like domain-containing protein [Luminiphilus sp.]|nr:Ig-like domain-containing protein [Luminiphilus sp.]MDA9667151.1 Ig-like domain-containing protein [Luminiphilus sp.]
MLLPRLISVHVVSVFVLILVPFFSNNTSADSFPGGVSHKASVGASGLTQYRASLDSFNPVAADGDTTGTFRVVLEEPVSGEIHGGIGNLRGWAIASDGIEKVEIWTDGVYSFDVPYGGARGDVAGAFPDVANSAESGFSMAYSYGNLSAGAHSISAVAYNASGVTHESVAQFEVVKFSEDFISGANAVDLSGGSCTASGDQISLVDALVSGTLYDLVLKWRVAEQGFEIVEIR